MDIKSVSEKVNVNALSMLLGVSRLQVEYGTSQIHREKVDGQYSYDTREALDAMAAYNWRMVAENVRKYEARVRGDGKRYLQNIEKYSRWLRRVNELIEEIDKCTQ